MAVFFSNYSKTIILFYLRFCESYSSYSEELFYVISFYISSNFNETIWADFEK